MSDKEFDSLSKDDFGYAEDEIPKGWDKGVDYEVEKQRLEELIADLKEAHNRVFYCVFLIQLVNGSRIGEAIAATQRWIREGKKEVRVRAEKRKDNKLRMMIIPNVVINAGITSDIVAVMTSYKDFRKTCKVYCTRLLGYNTHSLRFSRITYWSRTKTAQAIANITKHKRFDTIMRYQQDREADSTLRKEVE